MNPEDDGLLLRLWKAHIDALFVHREAHPMDDREFIPLLEAALSAFKDVGCDAVYLAELWEHTFDAFDRTCHLRDPASSSGENRALMRSLLIRPAITRAKDASTRIQKPYTTRQGQYLSFIFRYTQVQGLPPAQQDIATHFMTAPPNVHQMIVTLEKRGLISREPGVARSIRVLLPPELVPEGSMQW